MKDNNKPDNQINMKVHLSFKDLIKEIQNDRIMSGVDRIDDHPSIPKLTKAISNLIEANPKIKDMIIKVVINKNGK